MKVLVVEQDILENRCITALAKDSSIELLKLGYLNAAKGAKALKQIHHTINHKKIEIDQVNATDPDSLAEAAEGMDFIVDMTDTWMSPYVKKGAMQANVTYVNPKEDLGFWQKFIEGKRKLQNAPSIVFPVKQGSKHRKSI